MRNPISEMRDRLSERFTVSAKPIKGLRVTANDAPRLPQSTLASPKVKHDRPGRPSKPKGAF
jgi:hypothetical protein